MHYINSNVFIEINMQTRYIRQLRLPLCQLCWRRKMIKFGGNICIKFERAVGKSFSAKADDVNPGRSHLSSPLIHSHLHKINIVHLSDASLFFALNTPAKRRKILEIENSTFHGYVELGVMQAQGSGNDLNSRNVLSSLVPLTHWC